MANSTQPDPRTSNLGPDSAEPESLNLRGAHLLQQGALQDAEACFRGALSARPRYAVALHNLGVALTLQNRPADAAPVLREALAETPTAAETWLQLVAVETTLRQPTAITALLYDALSHVHEHPVLLHRLSENLLRQGRIAEAMTHAWHAVRVSVGIESGVDIRIYLAGLLQQQLQLDAAERLLREAHALAPADTRVSISLGAALYQRRRYREAAIWCDRGIERASYDSRAWTNRAMVHMALGETTSALAAFRKALTNSPKNPVAYSNLLLAMQYSDRISTLEIMQTARAYGQLLPSDAERFSNNPDSYRPLRLGYVSGDLRRHVVGTFVLPVFAHHNAADFEIHVYSMVDVPDPLTRQLAQFATSWLDVRSLSDESLAGRIRHDGIDVLVDLSGHSSNNRLGAFARGAAPVQVTWLGYPGHVGVPAIKHRMTDAVLDPDNESAEGLETAYRLPHGWFCYAPTPMWGGDRPVGALPVLHNGYVTFGAFNNLAKVSESCLDLWAAVLTAVPDSRLITRAKPFDDPAEQQRFKRAMNVRGVTVERVITLPYVPDPQAHMSVYDDVDIHLDSLPYSGGTTSCDALWMGVPVITLRGDRPSARLGASVLEQLGLRAWVADTAEDYVRIAQQLAGDIPGLQGVRGQLRGRFQTSPLHDAARFTRGLEQAYRELWQQWVVRHG